MWVEHVEMLEPEFTDKHYESPKGTSGYKKKQK